MQIFIRTLTPNYPIYTYPTYSTYVPGVYPATVSEAISIRMYQPPVSSAYYYPPIHASKEDVDAVIASGRNVVTTIGPYPV